MNRMQQSGLGLRTSNQYAAGRQFGRDLTNLNSDDETSYEAPKKEISHPLQQIKCPGLPNQLAGSFVGHPPNHYKTAPPYQMSENGELSKRGLPARQNFQRNAFENNLASGNLPLNKTCQGQNRLYNSQRNIGLQLKQSKLRDYQPLSQTQINLPAPLVPLVHSQGPPFQQQIPLPINLTSSQVQVPLQKPQLPEEVQVSEEYGDMDSELRNPQLCEEYQADIFDFCFKREVRNKHKNILTQQVKNLCKSNYFVLRQQSINDKMRAILIDWIVDVHAKFKMTPQTFFLSVNLIDRFLETFNCPRNQLQLVGIASLFLASKYEEIYPPELKDFSTVCDRTYSEDQIVDMESQILLTLSFDLVFTSCFQFHEMFCQKLGVCKEAYNLGLFLLYLSKLEFNMVKYRPSRMSLSAIYLANKFLKQDKWVPELPHVIGCTPQEVKNSSLELFLLAQKVKQSTLNAVVRKFSSKQYQGVANINIQL